MSMWLQRRHHLLFKTYCSRSGRNGRTVRPSLLLVFKACIHRDGHRSRDMAGKDCARYATFSESSPGDRSGKRCSPPRPRATGMEGYTRPFRGPWRSHFAHGHLVVTGDEATNWNKRAAELHELEAKYEKSFDEAMLAQDFSRARFIAAQLIAISPLNNNHRAKDLKAALLRDLFTRTSLIQTDAGLREVTLRANQILGLIDPTDAERDPDLHTLAAYIVWEVQRTRQLSLKRQRNVRMRSGLPKPIFRCVSSLQASFRIIWRIPSLMAASVPTRMRSDTVSRSRPGER